MDHPDRSSPPSLSRPPGPPMAIARLALVALLLAACGDVNEGPSGAVVEAHVVRVIESGQSDATGTAGPFQQLEVELDSSLYRGERHEVEWHGRRGLDAAGFVHAGDHVLLSVSRQGTTRTYQAVEVVRVPQLAPLGALAAIALLVVARLAGLAAIAGLAASVGVLLLAIVPAVQRGDDPLGATLVGSAIALTILVFTAAGLRRQGVAALAGALAGLIAVAGLGAGAIALTRLSGYTSDDAVLLAAAAGKVDLARVALASVIVAALGALSALSVAQATRTLDLAAADAEAPRRDLYLSAIGSGAANAGSLVNTVALATFAAVLPIVLVASLGSEPFSLSVNTEEIVLAIVMALAVSVGLVLCVPVATSVAVALARRPRI